MLKYIVSINTKKLHSLIKTSLFLLIIILNKNHENVKWYALFDVVANPVRGKWGSWS